MLIQKKNNTSNTATKYRHGFVTCCSIDIITLRSHGSICCTGQVLKETGPLYGKGMTIEHRGVSKVRGAASWQRSIRR
jgi:hypothetical protein